MPWRRARSKPLILAALKGKVVLLDFWPLRVAAASWTYRGTSGSTNRQEQRSSLVGLDMYGETPGAVRAFAAAHQMQYPLAIGTDEGGALYRLGAMPLTLPIDREGRIAVRHEGVVDPKLFEAEIRTLLAE